MADVAAPSPDHRADGDPGLQDALMSYIARQLHSEDVAITGLRRMTGGGSRESWSFDIEWSDDGQRQARGLVLRRDPEAGILTTDRAMEHAVLRALGATSIPTPESVWCEGSGTELTRPFQVMERIEGETSPELLANDPDLADARPAVAQQQLAVLAQLRQLDWQSVGLERALHVPKSTRECAVLEIDRWAATLDRELLEPQPALRAAVAWLRHHLPPEPSSISLVHGDYRSGNFVYDEAGEILAVLDWELAHLGDPLEDLGYLCLEGFHFGADDKVGGLMDREELTRLYEDMTGQSVDPEAMRFWEVLGNVKVAAILLTGARAYCDGRTRDLEMAIVGYAATRFAHGALKLIEGSDST